MGHSFKFLVLELLKFIDQAYQGKQPPLCLTNAVPLSEEHKTLHLNSYFFFMSGDKSHLCFQERIDGFAIFSHMIYLIYQIHNLNIVSFHLRKSPFRKLSLGLRVVILI